MLPVSDPLAAALARINSLVASRAAEQTPAATEPELAQIIYLPAWPDGVRGVPNCLLRSALFGAIRKGRRRYLRGEKLASIEGIEIRYTGERLDQGDLDVWQSILHAVREQQLGTKCRTTSYRLLKMMGKSVNGKNRSILHERIARLVANAVEVKQGRYTYMGSLVSCAFKDEETQEWVIEVDANLKPLFDTDQFTQLEWSVRHTLEGKQLAQWLHGFYSTHAAPYPYTVAKLRELCGSETGYLFHFRAELREALTQVASVAGWTWEIDGGDLVHIHKPPTPAQARHLLKKATRGKKPR